MRIRSRIFVAILTRVGSCILEFFVRKKNVSNMISIVLNSGSLLYFHYHPIILYIQDLRDYINTIPLRNLHISLGLFLLMLSCLCLSVQSRTTLSFVLYVSCLLHSVSAAVFPFPSGPEEVWKLPIRINTCSFIKREFFLMISTVVLDWLLH